MRFLVRVVVNALALAVAAWLFDGITVTGADTAHKALTLLGVAIVFGLVNAIIAPIVKLLSLPFIILTLGLLIFVINALMLLLTSWISDGLDIPFEVDGFGTALIGALIITVVSWLMNVVLPDRLETN